MIEIDLRIAGTTSNGNEPVELRKLAVHTILSPHSDAPTLHYLELCAFSEFGVQISSSNVTLEAEDCSRFYRDPGPSDSMFQGYERLDIGTFKHRQTVEDEHLTVVPQIPQIDIVAANDGVARTNVQAIVARSSAVQNGESYGCWLKLTSPSGENWRGSASVRVQFRIALIDLRVAHLYSFTLLPQGYKPIPDDLKLESIPSRPSQADLLPANEFELPSTFSVYDEWRPHAYGASWLSSRRGIRIERDSTLIIGFRANDETYAARLSTQSFFGGVVLSVAANALTTTLFALAASSLSDNALLIVTVLLALMTAGSVWIGYQALTRTR